MFVTIYHQAMTFVMKRMLVIYTYNEWYSKSNFKLMNFQKPNEYITISGHQEYKEWSFLFNRRFMQNVIWLLLQEYNMNKWNKIILCMSNIHKTLFNFVENWFYVNKMSNINFKNNIVCKHNSSTIIWWSHFFFIIESSNCFIFRFNLIK
jgi:hypothetical protein